MELSKDDLALIASTLQKDINELVDNKKHAQAYKLCLLRDKIQNELEIIRVSNDCHDEFTFGVQQYRAFPDGRVDRYDGPRIGWSRTSNLAVVLYARSLGLFKDGEPS